MCGPPRGPTSPRCQTPLTIPRPMRFDSRYLGVFGLLIFSAAITWLRNNLFDVSRDLAAHLYLTGFGTVAVSLYFHLKVTRRFLSQSSLPRMVLGVLISGCIAWVVYSIFIGFTLRITYLLREDSEWGDVGSNYGLGAHATRIQWQKFITSVPSILKVSLITSVIWLPCLVILEKFSYNSVDRQGAIKDR